MPNRDIVSTISLQTKIYVLVAEAQEGQLSMSQMAELADALASDPAERSELTQKALEKLIMVSMPAGRVADLRRALGAEPPASIPTPAPQAQPAADLPAEGTTQQQTKTVPPAFKVPFAGGEADASIPANPEVEAEAARAADEGDFDPEHIPEVMDTGQFSADWSELEREVKRAAVPPRPKPPKAPLPIRGKAAQIMSQGGAAAPPPVRHQTSSMPRSSAEPVMRRDTMQFGSSVRGMESPKQEETGRPTILVADDDGRIRMVFKIKLEQKGFRVIEATDGAQAWKAIERGGIDAIVLDMKMPGLHGLEVMQRLSDSGKQIPVVICTAYDRLDDEFVVATYPKLRYLTKPVDAEQLAVTLTNLLAEER